MQLVSLVGDLGPKWFHVALRALTLLAQSETMLSSSHISDKLNTECTYLRKILVRLAKNGILTTHAGRYGGYELRKSAAEIFVGDVYRSLADSVTTPYYSVAATGAEQFISLIVSKAEKEFQATLDQFTIADLVTNLH
ncbi:MAG: Rrf2 family transcriptional regulator [Gracilibacteraceae bacterium]|jgi:Rrf2 family protein|nr:Rrf2 family transcriptional regulator [Gracilibacteraceae bacterium]